MLLFVLKLIFLIKFLNASLVRSYEYDLIKNNQLYEFNGVGKILKVTQSQIPSLPPLPTQRVQSQLDHQTVVESPSNIIAKLGDKVVLKCKFKSLKGEPQWCLDDFCLGITKELTLKGRPRHRIVGDQLNGEYHLQIESVQLQDNMFYYCMATAASETIRAVKSNRASLTVITYPQLLHLDSPVHVSLNKPSLIQCVAYRSRPPVRLFISIDGEIISDISKYSISLQEIPMTNNLQSEINEAKQLPFVDQLKYYYYNTIVNITLDNINMNLQNKLIECNAYEMGIFENPYALKTINELKNFKPIMSTSSIIQVDYAPEVTLKLASTNSDFKENDVFSLICAAKASPAVHSYKWYLGKSYLNDVNSDTLNLKLRKEMNLETISCEATNTIATVKASLQLNIKYKPYYLKGLQTYLLIDKETCNKPLTLDCHVDSNPASNITWYKINFNQQEQKFHRILIGYGTIYTIASLNCGNLRINGFNDTIRGLSDTNTLLNADLDGYFRYLSQMNNDYYSSDFGLYVCEANNGYVENNQNLIVKRNIKINPLSVPVTRLLVSDSDQHTDNDNRSDELNDESSSSNDDNMYYYDDTRTTLTYTIKLASIGSTVKLTCFVEPLPQFKGVIWSRDLNGNQLTDTRYINTDNGELADEINNSNNNFDDEFIDDVYDNQHKLDENDEIAINKNLTYKYLFESSNEGLKSILKVKLTNKADFGLYRCKTWNKYGYKEVAVLLKEDTYSKTFLSRLTDKYPMLYIIGYILLGVIILLLSSLLILCLMKKDDKNISKMSKFLDLIYICKTRNGKSNGKMMKNKSLSTTAIGIGVNSDTSATTSSGTSTSSSSSTASTNAVGEIINGGHSAGSSHLSATQTDSKAIDEWLATTPKFNSVHTTNGILSTGQQQQQQQQQHHNHHYATANRTHHAYNHHFSPTLQHQHKQYPHETELLLQNSSALTVLKNKNAKDSNSILNMSMLDNNHDNHVTRNNEIPNSDMSIDKLLSNATYRLSDLFKELSPSLINNSSNSNAANASTNSDTNTMTRYKTSLSRNSNNNGNRLIKNTLQKVDLTSNGTPIATSSLTKLQSIQSPKLRISGATTTFLSSTSPLPPPPPPPPPPTTTSSSSAITSPLLLNSPSPKSNTSTFHHHTTIHSNMKNIPYTTLSKYYNNIYYRPKNLLSASDIENDDDELNNESFNEYSRLNSENAKKNDKFQTIV